jgi:hypothetical protein
MILTCVGGGDALYDIKAKVGNLRKMKIRQSEEPGPPASPAG